MNYFMSKTSEFPIGLLEVKFRFGNVKLFGNGSQCEIILVMSKKFYIPNMKLHFQNMDYKFRNLGQPLHCLKLYS